MQKGKRPQDNDTLVYIISGVHANGFYWLESALRISQKGLYFSVVICYNTTCKKPRFGLPQLWKTAIEKMEETT